MSETEDFRRNTRYVLTEIVTPMGAALVLSAWLWHAQWLDGMMIRIPVIVFLVGFAVVYSLLGLVPQSSPSVGMTTRAVQRELIKIEHYANTQSVFNR